MGFRNGTWVSTSVRGFKEKISSFVRIGLIILGPFPSKILKSIPIAGSGVRISENIITPSTPNFRHGCNDNSIAISGVSERSLNGYFSE